MLPLLIAALLAFTPDDANALARQSQQALRTQQFDKALQLAEQAVAADPKSVAAYVARGCARFQLTQVPGSVADFEKAAKLDPQVKPHLWQLGIAYYYAGRYADGARQFALHKTVNPDDVENAAWHYLCTARAEGIEKANANFMGIHVERDTRVPMREIYALYGGRAKPSVVFTTAAAPGVAEAEAVRRRFYANLYVGLYYEAQGNPAGAKKHLEQAAADAPQVGDYMAGVARVHVALLKKKAAGK